MTETVRLAKRIAEIVHCSRAEATQYIEGGWVKVGSHIVEEPGFKVSTQDQVELLPDAILAPLEPVTLLLHKPSGVPADTAVQLITPDKLYPEDRSGMRFLKRHMTGLSMLMPMETAASGLLVLTQDWRVVRKLTDDAAKIEQEIIVDIAGELIPDGLALLNHGTTFNGKALPPMKISWQNETRLRFAIKAPQSGLIQHMCKQVGLTPLAVKRIRLGRVPMAGLKMGQWRYLLAHERF
jgi:23S rRNA pseudouridine2604 synthase